MPMKHITAVVPLMNEAESLPELHRQLSEVAERERYELRMIFVDDGSTDGSWRVIESLATQDARVLGVRFRRNFGKAAALSAGFGLAEDPFVVTLDADLQDDPAEIPNLLAALEGDGADSTYDVVSGWKQKRHDPSSKVRVSRVFNWMVSRLTGVHLHDHNCGLKAYRLDVLHEVRLYGELHRFVPVLAAARGFKVTEIVVQHRARKFGESKYGVSRIVKGLLDLATVKFITGYGDRPQHVLGTIGLGAFSLGSFGFVFLGLRWVFSRVVPGLEPVHLHQTAAIYYCLALLMVGSQFLSIGLLGEMITAYFTRDSDTFSVAQYTTAGDAENSVQSARPTAEVKPQADEVDSPQAQP